MAEGSMENGTFTLTAGKTWTGTTDAQGKLKFGEGQLMAYNPNSAQIYLIHSKFQNFYHL